jgi:uncharacterized integral membrane protein
MARYFVLGVKILCVGLLIHFLVHTLMTYGIGIEMGPLWAWKELVIAVLFMIFLYVLIFHNQWKILFSTHRSFFLIVGVLALGVIGTLLIHLARIDAPITRRAMAMRYDYLWFMLLVLWWASSLFMQKETAEKLLKRYGRVIKRVLVGALIRWCIVAIKPWTLKLFGFNNYVFEWTVGMQPPAVYYTHINYWLPRSQFRFERPTTFWFWLTAFFPLFFMQFLRRRPWQETRAWWWIYWLNIILTFSRAARWSWIIVVVVCIGLTSNLPRKKLLLRYWLPLLLWFGAILLVWREQIALRWYSNYGHMTMVKRGREMLIEKPLRWRWWASVGPWSHRDGWLAFNPENQFLQILIEFWKIGALPRLFLRGWAIRIWIFARTKENERIMAFSLGMMTLTVSGMVLHSFADRMVVYPFMLLFGIALWDHLSLQEKHTTT